MNNPVLLVLVLSVVLFSSCTGQESAPKDSHATDAVPTEAPESIPASSMVLGLSGEGLQFIDANSGSSRTLMMDQVAFDTVIMATSSVLGELSQRGECEVRGLVTASWDNGLTILSEGENFNGFWYSESGEPVLTTMSGIGIGTTVAEATETMVGEVVEASFGTLLVMDRLIGVLEGDGETAAITALYSGSVCIAD